MCQCIYAVRVPLTLLSFSNVRQNKPFYFIFLIGFGSMLENLDIHYSLIELD